MSEEIEEKTFMKILNENLHFSATQFLLRPYFPLYFQKVVVPLDIIKIKNAHVFDYFLIVGFLLINFSLFKMKFITTSNEDLD